MPFYLFIGFVILQRLAELIIARKNERWMKSRGAVETGQGHYKAMVVIHVAFLLSTILEVKWFNRELSDFWPLLLSLFFAAQIMRIWALTSLGNFWNTKIIILPGADVVQKGPYRIMKHPNYVVVVTEIIVIPLMFNAVITAVVFTVLNIIILSFRIPAEEKALKELTHYGSAFEKSNRFLPNLLNKYDNQ
ncbi:isoprenylcysteine carboxyl methyltransferase family protein [Mesobacillus zeae]|uniref:Isoprenylcysteine carboxyl methyltransferase n=1 Tax=Mesobacillus zeae TaxID=1917180 RepID=A0A398B3N4_9BACI|nr:isoprenylcysteine carboxylmethyltransferase family protein [Mesobacillus zeae]RID84191.1 hypothetical protein D1970_13825 [Mesobacillus zeae]